LPVAWLCPKLKAQWLGPFRVSVCDERTFNFGQFRVSTLEFGGADRDRTGDPLLAKQVLSQLSYSPVNTIGGPG
jgi:hypothetical protein